VSQQLAALEREVGQPVIERNGRGIRLTGAAEVLVGHANVVLAQLEAAAADVAAYSEGVVGTVRIAGFATALAEIVAPAAAGLRGTHPRLALTISEQEAPGLLPRARARRRRHRAVDGLRASRRRATTRASRSGPCAPTCSTPSCPPATRSPPRADRALRSGAEPFVGPPDGTSCHDVTVSGCAAAGFSPLIEHWSLDFHTTMALVAAGLGVALVPRMAQAVVPAGAVVRPLTAPAPARRVFAAPARAPSGAPRSPPSSTRSVAGHERRALRRVARRGRPVAADRPRDGTPSRATRAGRRRGSRSIPRCSPRSTALATGERVIVLTWLDRADRGVLRVHPRDDPANPETGVFGTRSADRPNPIGLHEVTILALDGTRMRVAPLEAVDGTPVIDVKPVL
jgi:DNA-binding transcriptional LysR family regulator